MSSWPETRAWEAQTWISWSVETFLLRGKRAAMKRRSSWHHSRSPRLLRIWTWLIFNWGSFAFMWLQVVRNFTFFLLSWVFTPRKLKFPCWITRPATWSGFTEMMSKFHFPCRIMRHATWSGFIGIMPWFDILNQGVCPANLFLAVDIIANSSNICKKCVRMLKYFCYLLPLWSALSTATAFDGSIPHKWE